VRKVIWQNEDIIQSCVAIKALDGSALPAHHATMHAYARINFTGCDD
jgi:hypothetical protein